MSRWLSGPRFAERLLTGYLRRVGYRRLALEKLAHKTVPRLGAGHRYMLYAHVPFCEVLCPYRSFNRYPFREELARGYFDVGGAHTRVFKHGLAPHRRANW